MLLYFFRLSPFRLRGIDVGFPPLTRSLERKILHSIQYIIRDNSVIFKQLLLALFDPLSI